MHKQEKLRELSLERVALFEILIKINHTVFVEQVKGRLGFITKIISITNHFIW